MDISTLRIPAGCFFNLLLRNTNVGCWMIDLQNHQSWWSDSYYEMLGIEDKNEVQSLDDFLDKTVHPSDRHIITSAIKNYLFYHAASEKNEIRLKHRNGYYNWYETFSEATYDEHNNLRYVLGGFINIGDKKIYADETEKLQNFIQAVEDMLHVGVYERNLETNERVWSRLMYDIYELPYGTFWPLDTVADSFVGEDKNLILRALDELRNNKKPFDLELQLITAKANQTWIRAMAQPIVNSQNKVTGYRGIFQRIEQQKIKENFLIDIKNKITEQNFFLDETSAMSHVGGWEIDVSTNVLYWSKQTKRIHEVDDNFVPSFETALNFYAPASQERLKLHFNKLLNTGKPYDLELELCTAQNNRIWVRSIGKPILDKEGRLVKIRGVIQNISEQKEKELELNSAIDIIHGQNDKLKDFTYIVSHNLRSHAGNLQMITEMIELEQDLDIKLEWIDFIKNVSASLSQTINNLNGLCSINIEDKKRVFFRETFCNISNALNYKLINENVQLTADFSACECINYLPAYLESILLNLITNAIKYKHPNRDPIIFLQTGIDDKGPFLNVTDNGIGIDLKRFGNRIFKMNQTFHENSDARGIGLYITKNQVDNMGGTIEVKSTVEEGTTFTIHF